ncbi:saccharopine dehydrogenase-like oxidoreductase [Spea bombifrons]|uniref:saccharopine dehydrogenase-like oxidoreductase n=1 Tax=Spea bombifrons TaxID=233779 RepID=UPI00234AB44B|nr:saccharopine dehydrogenase-like oxidoreductase [Spea bombifrons]
MATEAAGRQYQMVVLGASGFTGQYVVEEVARLLDGEEFKGPGLRWAVAGRSREKLEDVLRRAADRMAKPQLKSDVGVIICDVNDPPSLAEMCKKASVVLDCVGPYRFFGEPVVKACVENGAHFLDISGEPQFLEGMYLKYDSLAAEKGVYIVGSTGFDSIPADMGVLFTRNSLKGTLTAVESFLSFKSGPSGISLHDGTWQSAVYGVADQGNLKNLRKQLAYKRLPVIGRKLKRRGPVFYSNEVKKYAVLFPGSDASVVRRTQRYLHEHLQETPVQYSAYAAIGGLGSVITLMIAGFFFFLFSKLSCGRKLLIKYPKFFSFGYFSAEGPTQKQMDEASFSMTFFGEGYSEGQDPQQGKPNLKICTQVSGPEVAYVSTPIAMVQAAATILKEPESLPKRGGVFTPGAAFSKTKLIERLDKAGINFTVISKSDA